MTFRLIEVPTPMAKKGGMPVYETVDDYIDDQSSEAQPLLEQLRKLISAAVAGVQEVPNSKVPTFKLVPGAKPEQQIMIAAYNKYVSFYPYQATIDQFAEQLKEYELGKGTVKFAFDEPLPAKLIKQMVEFRKQELLGESD